MNETKRMKCDKHNADNTNNEIRTYTKTLYSKNDNSISNLKFMNELQYDLKEKSYEATELSKRKKERVMQASEWKTESKRNVY